MDEWTIKTQNPICQLFFQMTCKRILRHSVYLSDFLDWRCINSWFVFSAQLVNCCPHGRRNYMVLVYCCPSTVPSLWPPPPSPPSQCTVYTDSVWQWGVGGGCVEMYCGPYSTGVLHSVSDQIQNLQNCFNTPNKMTRKDDIKGLVSLKFLRPCMRTIFC